MDISITEALKELEIGRTKLYGLFGQLEIKPQKNGNKSFLTLQQVALIKDFIKKSKPSEQSAQHEQQERFQGKNNKTNFYERRIEQLEAELKEERADNKKLIQEVGRWEGVARTLQDQNQKLLEVKTVEDETDIIDTDAEMVEPETTPAPEAKAEKRGFFQKIFRFK